ncbi:MAG TPA: hypothetical protein ENN99_09835 [Chloroflexi bacterium]|nr:hypothetical protein [Chloroflexota bacterium]
MHKKPKDRDFIRTVEGMFFCVTGYLHPPDRYTAYLKYSPDPAGRWRARHEDIAYRREIPYYHVRSVAETIGYLEQHYPHYVSDCPVRGIRFSMVPQASVAQYYDPRTRLQALIATPSDPLEVEARDLAVEIAASAGISAADLGVTGSILIGLHHPALSDINLTVYGGENGRRVRDALRERQGRRPAVRPPDDALLARWAEEMAAWFPLTLEEAAYNVGRRWNYGVYRGRFFGIHPTRSDAEITEQYGDHVYRGQGRARIRAALTAADEAIFQPAIYRVGAVRVLAGDAAAEGVQEVISYEGRYRDIAKVGQTIEAVGQLETVDGEPRRLVVGAAALDGAEYIKPTEDREK